MGTSTCMGVVISYNDVTIVSCIMQAVSVLTRVCVCVCVCGVFLKIDHIHL